MSFPELFEKPLEKTIVGVLFLCVFWLLISRNNCHNINTHYVLENFTVVNTALIRTQMINVGKNLPQPGVLLKPIGGIGNQLFQYACSYALAEERKWPLYIRKDGNSDSRKFGAANREFCLDQFTISTLKTYNASTNITNVAYIGDTQYLDRNFPSVITNSSGFIQLNGYCQSPTYWINASEELQSMLQPSAAISNSLPDILLSTLHLILSSESVAIHVRRGDFIVVGESAFYLPIAFQRIAVHRMVKELNKQNLPRPVFFVFSDEISYAKTNFADMEEKWKFVYVSELNTTSLQDLYLMIVCKHIVFPNSTFSWWAAFLNTYENKILITSTFNPIWWKRHGVRRLHGKNYHFHSWIVLDIFSGEY